MRDSIPKSSTTSLPGHFLVLVYPLWCRYPRTFPPSSTYSIEASPKREQEARKHPFPHINCLPALRATPTRHPLRATHSTVRFLPLLPPIRDPGASQFFHQTMCLPAKAHTPPPPVLFPMSHTCIEKFGLS